ncbi:hypothetical protein BGZ52_010482 [Haplosporangium bisporale]|nr:hypothetical protein BGZ52_010482 [Haplosporangium bisporale]
MDLPPSYSTLTAPYMEVARVCVITLNENDKIRLIATPPELVQAVRQVQREQDYADAHEFKLEGYPWQGDGKESVMCRRLLTHIMRNMAAYGWSLIQAVDMSKKQMDKDSFFFELRPVVDFKADLFAISFNKSDGIRVVDAPQVVLAVRQAIVAQWKEGIQHEKEYEGSIEFKLLGNPFYSDRHGAVYARMLMAQLLANLRFQGYKLYCSADVSFGVDGMDLDSWIFAVLGQLGHFRNLHFV